MITGDNGKHVSGPPPDSNCTNATLGGVLTQDANFAGDHLESLRSIYRQLKPVKSYELHVECGIATRKKSPNSESFNFSEVAFSVWVPRHAALLADAPPPGPVRSLEMLRLKGKFFALWKLSRLWVQYFNCRKMRILRLRIRFVPKTSVWGFFEVSVSAGSFRKGSKLEHSRRCRAFVFCLKASWLSM